VACRYRTQLCNDGTKCRRHICFFAHSLEELRVPTCKPFVPPDAVAAATSAAAADFARKVKLSVFGSRSNLLSSYTALAHHRSMCTLKPIFLHLAFRSYSLQLANEGLSSLDLYAFFQSWTSMMCAFGRVSHCRWAISFKSEATHL